MNKVTVCDSETKKSVTEEEGALEEERKKNLSILQSVLGSGQQTSSSKTASKAKTFRSAIQTWKQSLEHLIFNRKYILKMLFVCLQRRLSAALRPQQRGTRCI